VTGSWVTVTGKRRDDELLIYFYDASPAWVILQRACAGRALNAANEYVRDKSADA
jgi:hypothetical protein